MSALPQPTPTPRPVIDLGRWIALPEAAARLSRNPQHLARVAREQLVTMKMAIKAPPPEGGADQWWINRDYHRCLSTAPDAHRHQEPQLDQFPEHQVRKAWDRVAVVKAYREARRSTREPIKGWLPRFVDRMNEKFPKLRMSDSSVRRWDRVYKCPADTVKLIDTRGGNTTGGADPACWEFFRGQFLDQNQPALSDCWRRTRNYARAEGLTWCSEQACRNQLDQRIPPAVQARHRRPRDYRNKFEPYVERDPEQFGPGIMYVGDHRQLDVHVRFGERILRPWITAWQDWRSRKIVGWVMSDQPNSSTILAAFRMALMDPDHFGGPDKVHTDNGKDYDSSIFDGRTKRERLGQLRGKDLMVESEASGIFNWLKIDISFSLPYNPRGKSRMERWFGTMAGQFDKRFVTYAGSTPEERPERLASVLKQDHRVPTFEEVERELGLYIDEYNHSAEHSIEDLVIDGRKVSPAEMMTHCPRERKLAEPKVLDLLMAKWPEPVRVHRNGVSVRFKGKVIRYGAHEPSLRRFIGTDKLVRVAYDPHDIRTVRVLDEQGRYLCTARSNRSLGHEPVSENAVGEQIAEQRRVRKAEKIARDSWRYHCIPFESRVAEQERRKATPPPVDPKPMKIIPTPFDEAANDLQRDVKRVAAGAEGSSMAGGLPDITKLLGDMDDQLFIPERDEEPDMLTALGRIYNDAYIKPRPRIILPSAERLSLGAAGCSDEDDEVGFDLVELHREGGAA